MSAQHSPSFTCLIFPLSTFPFVFDFDYFHNCPLLRGWGDQLCAKNMFTCYQIKCIEQKWVLCSVYFLLPHDIIEFYEQLPLLMCFGAFSVKPVRFAFAVCIVLCCHCNWTAVYLKAFFFPPGKQYKRVYVVEHDCLLWWGCFINCPA